MDPITELLLKPECLYLMGAVWVILETLRRVLPVKVTSNGVYIRMMPLYPIILCLAGAFIPGILAPELHPSSKILVGVILGWGAGHMQKIFMQTVLGRDSKLAQAIGEPQAPAVTPPPEDKPAAPSN